MTPEQIAAITPFGKDSTVTWCWWSWSIKRTKWCRSCWEAPTREEAIAMLREPAAAELWDYVNLLVREETIYTPIGEENDGDKYIATEKTYLQTIAELTTKLAAATKELALLKNPSHETVS